MVWPMVLVARTIWAFILATRLPESLRNEFRERGRDDGSDYGKSIAMTLAVLGVIGILLNGVNRGSPEVAQIGGCVGGLLGLVQFVLWIVFWVKVANYSSQLASDGYDRRDFGDDYGRYDAGERGDRDPPRGGGPSSTDTYRPSDGGYTP